MEVELHQKIQSHDVCLSAVTLLNIGFIHVPARLKQTKIKLIRYDIILPKNIEFPHSFYTLKRLEVIKCFFVFCPVMISVLILSLETKKKKKK